MADASSKTGQDAHTRVTDAIHITFMPLDDVASISATISRDTARSLLEQLERQLRPGSVDDDGQSTA